MTNRMTENDEDIGNDNKQMWTPGDILGPL